MAWTLGDAGFEGVVLHPRGHGGSDRSNGQGLKLNHWERLDLTAAIQALIT